MDKYTKIFIDTLHNNFKNSLFIENLEPKDLEIIDRISIKYYPSIYYKVFLQKGYKTELLYNPYSAEDFNFTLTSLINEAVRLLFYKNSPHPYFQKEMFFEALLKTIEYQLSKVEYSSLNNFEIIDNIITKIDKKFQKITDDHKYNFSGYKISFYNRFREYIKQKHKYILDKIDSLVESKVNYKLYSNLLIIFSLSFLLISIFLDAKSLYFGYAYKTILITIILASFIFPKYVIDVKKRFQLLKPKTPLDLHWRLGVDIIRILVSQEELKYVDPEDKNILLPIIAKIRLSLTDTYGYVLPSVRVLDSTLFKNGYKIALRGNELIYLDISLGSNVITEENRQKYNIEINENIEKKETEFGEYYSVSKEFCTNIDKEAYYTGAEYMEKILTETFLKYVNLLLTYKQTIIILELYQKSNKVGYEKLYKALDEFELTEIFVKLLQKRCPIKDVDYIMEKIIKYSKQSKDPDIIAYNIHADMVKDNFIVE